LACLLKNRQEIEIEDERPEGELENNGSEENEAGHMTL